MAICWKEISSWLSTGTALAWWPSAGKRCSLGFPLVLFQPGGRLLESDVLLAFHWCCFSLVAVCWKVMFSWLSTGAVSAWWPSAGKWCSLGFPLVLFQPGGRLLESDVLLAFHWCCFSLVAVCWKVMFSWLSTGAVSAWWPSAGKWCSLGFPLVLFQPGGRLLESDVLLAFHWCCFSLVAVCWKEMSSCLSTGAVLAWWPFAGKRCPLCFPVVLF